MGLRDVLKQRADQRAQKIELRTVQRKLQIREANALTDYIDALSPDPRLRKELEDPDADQWTGIEGGDPNNPRKIDPFDAEDLYDQAQQFFYRTPHGRNIVRLVEKYVVGRGFQISPKAEEEDVQEAWDTFWKTNKWEQRKREWVRRVIRSGEAFIRYFVVGPTLSVRFMNPKRIKEPDDPEDAIQGDASWGVETNPDDIEDVFAYWYNERRIPADEVQHTKIYADSDVKRGRSIYEPIAPDLTMYRDWQKDRMKLNKIRNVLGLVRKVQAGTTKSANIAAGYKTNRLKAPDGSSYMQFPESVSVLTVNKGVDYDLLSPNLQAADVQHDGRMLLLGMAAGVGMPEFMLTSDASNANFASTLVAEGPGVMEFEDWQDFFMEEFKIMYEKVINTGISRGMINEFVTKEVETETDEMNPDGTLKVMTEMITERVSTECDIQFPDVAVHDILKETQAVTAQESSRYISRRTATAVLGYNYDDEQELIKQEEKDDMEPEDPFTTEEPEPETDEERGVEPVEK